MDKIQEVRHRWRLAKERKSLDHMSKEEILADGLMQQARIDELERNLTDALNPVSSKFGALTELRDGILYYRVNGMLIPISAITAGLRLLNDLRKSGAALSEGQLAEEAVMLKIIEDVFRERAF